MNKNKKLTKSQKQAFKLGKTQLNQQINDFIISKKFKKVIKNKKIINPELLNLPVIKNGTENKVQQTEKDFWKIKHQYEKSNSIKDKLLYKKIKTALKKEKKIEKEEIKQIKVLNSKPKGQVNISVEKKIAIKVIDVNKYYPNKGFIKKALSNVNLSFKKGSFNVILGESGSGKTTLLNVISGLDRATSGQVIINDVNIQALNDKELVLFRRENTGFVFQSYNLLTALNVRDNIEIGRSLQNDGNKKQDISSLLKNMNMYDQEKKMIYELSGGQQQRVSIARALAKTPNILICDEPTGSLDQMTSKKVFDIFKNVNKQYGITIIIVTHNPKVANIAHQVINIEDGKITNIHHNLSPMKGFKF